MRDIRPNKNPGNPTPPPEDLPPEAKKLYEKHAVKKPRFSGSKVDVARVHVPRQSIDHAKGSVRRRGKQEEPTEAARPLFATPTPAPAARSKMRIGHKERKVVAGLIVLLLLALAAAGALFLPQANIRLVLETAPLLLDQKLTMRSNDSAAADAVPGTPYEVEVKVDGSSPVVSTEVVGTKATGTVQIVNRTLEEQAIKELSRLVTADGTLFYMQKHAIVPPDSSIPVTVEAAEAGESGNVASGRLNFAALDSSAQSVVYAEVTSPITGGSGDTVKVVKEEDLSQAKQDAGVAARQKVEQEIRAELPEGWTLLEESWNMTINDFQTEAVIDERLEEIAYSAHILVQVMAYEEKELENRLKTALEGRLDDEYMLFPGPISFTKSVDEINWEDGQAQVTVRVTHTTVPTFSLDTLKDKLAGRSEEEALAYLQGLKGVSSASIDLSPFWVSSIPRIDQRISIDIVSDRQP